MSGFTDFAFGAPGRIEAVPTGTPQQQDLISQLLSMLGGGQGGQGGALGGGIQNLQQLLAGGGEAFEAPAMRQFQEQTVPKIAERFAGLEAQSSSAFPQALSQAAAGLTENLAAQRAGLQSEGMQQLLQLLGISQQPQFAPTAIPQGKGFLLEFLKTLSGFIPGGGGSK